jgi:hypothetical protein
LINKKTGNLKLIERSLGLANKLLFQLVDDLSSTISCFGLDSNQHCKAKLIHYLSSFSLRVLSRTAGTYFPQPDLHREGFKRSA